MKYFFKKNNKKILYIFIFVICIILFSILPKVGNDFNNHIELKNLVETCDGLFLGNILTNLLRYSSILRILFCSLNVTLLVYFSSKLCSSKYSFILIIFLLLLMPFLNFNNSVLSLHYFVNYFTPIVIMIIMFYLLKIKGNCVKGKSSLCYSILLFFTIMILGLFSKFFATVSVFLSVMLIIISLMNKKSINDSVCVLIGSLLSLVIIFLLPNKSLIVESHYGLFFNNYSIIEKLIYNLKNSILVQSFFFGNFVIFAIILIILLSNIKKFNNALSKICIAIQLVIVLLFFPLINYTNLFANLKIQIILITFFLISLCYLLYKAFYKDKVLIFLYSIIVLIGVLIVLSLIRYPINLSVLISCYVLLVIFILLLFNNSLIVKWDKIYVIAGSISFILLATLFYMLTLNYKIFLQRERIIKQSVINNSSIIILPEYKIKFLIPSDKDNMFNQSSNIKLFKRYYDINEDVLLLEGKNSLKNNPSMHYEDYINVSSDELLNQATHPCVIYLDKKISGYKYWMVYTPWPNDNNYYENPHVVASNDGIIWETPNGLNNPISSYPKQKNDYYSDPYILYNNGFEVWYRYNPYNYNNHKSLTDNNLIIRQTSKDGINWSKQEIVLDDDSINAYMSISVIKENNKYKVWYVNYDKHLYYRETSNDKWSSWSKEQLVDIQDNVSLVWHGEVKKIFNKYVGLFLTNSQKNPYDRQLFFATSSNGKKFINSKILDTNQLKKQHKVSRIYKSSFIVDDKNLYLYIPYNNKRKKMSWQIYLKTYEKSYLEKKFIN